MKFINLTPHEIILCGRIIPSTGLARCDSVVEKVMEIDSVCVNRRSFGEVTGLPEPERDTVYIVSRIVAEAVSGRRNDVFVVDETVRDENGKIIGCKSLARV